MIRRPVTAAPAPARVLTLHRRDVRLLAVCVVTLLTLAPGSCGADAGPSLELAVRPDQSVHLAGASESLRTVVETLCARAGIELRAYRAPDRAFAGSYRDVPASDLLPRLLREESHAMGLSGADGRRFPRIAWLRVLGAEEQTSAVTRPTTSASASEPPPPATPAQTFEADKERILALLLPAFEADRPDREAAVRDVVRRLANEPESREPFLGATQTDVAQEIAEYSDARQVLAAIRLGIDDQEARRNFDRIVQQVNLALQNRPARH